MPIDTWPRSWWARAVDWVREFYSRAAVWWSKAEGQIGKRDHQRVALLHEHAGAGPHRVLDLGSGYGSTAAALAAAGHTVTAIEVSDAADIAAARFADLPTTGSVTYLKQDFYQVRLGHRFDVVCCWDGFGIGSDADQHRLLARIATEWLRQDGTALIDVFNPFVWARWDGDLEHKPALPDLGYDHELYEQCRFDPVTCTAIDTWWPAGDPDDAISQRIRCYTPADLALLLTGTGLVLTRIVVGDRAYPPATPQPSRSDLLQDRGHYLAVLRPAQGTDTGPNR